MRNETKTFIGPFASDIENYLNEKVNLGHKITSYIYALKSFDTFSQQYNKNLKILTKELLEAWLNSKPNEKINNTLSRATIIRGFSKYMNMKNSSNYILVDGIYNKGIRYNAYIFSDLEIKKIFNEIDIKIQKNSNSYSANSTKIIFSLLYACGMRVSEVLNIKVKDFDEHQKIITIYKGKNEKDRIIPLTNYLSDMITDFINKFQKYLKLESFLFEHKNNNPYSRFTINHRFWKLLSKCHIHHDESGPRLHDFRHTFAVHCLRKWEQENKDLNVYLPILQTYLGHSDFKCTAYYLKLTADVYTKITEKIEKDFNIIVPYIGGETL